MRSALRYTISLGVGLVITFLTVKFSATGHSITLSLLPLYGVVTSMILAHKQQWLSLSRGGPNWSARKRGAVIGGTGALTGSLLLQSSVSAALAGYELLLLGTAETIAEGDKT